MKEMLKLARAAIDAGRDRSSFAQEAEAAFDEASQECKHAWERSWGFGAPIIRCKTCGHWEYD
ncbi:MAG: hypothetical protein E5W06_00345 [Mesorhizobium sp.]|nr:MAG: hypothetical protein E5W06_00345 [Mesorhizobium sp.]